MQSFAELSLSAPLARAIQDLGYEKPSAIQASTLPILLERATDFLGLAATGTGKTAAFSIPLLERLNPEIKGVQALILCPTRELALQVRGQIDLLGKHMGVRTVAIYGGAGYSEQIQGLRQGASIVVGTPGRVIDHLEKGTLQLSGLTTLVLDEADEMISMGFKDELEAILEKCPRESSQIWLFSATMSREVRKIADTYLREPEFVQVNRTEIVPTSIEQHYFATRESDKPEVLCKLIEAAENFYGVIFCQTKALVVDLTQYLGERGYKVDCLHGDKDQNARERTMDAFRKRKVSILVCTDVAARGLDVKDITHVVNYSLPRELDTYVHRIGRTARSGKTGMAFNLVTPTHRRLIFQIEAFTKTQMQEGKIPSRREIGARRVSKQLAQFLDQPFHARVLDVMSEEWKSALQNLTAEEVASRFFAMMMPEIFNDRHSFKSEQRQEPKATAAASETSAAKTFEHNPELDEPSQAANPIERRPRPSANRGERRSEQGRSFHRDRPDRGQQFESRPPRRGRDFDSRSQRRGQEFEGRSPRRDQDFGARPSRRGPDFEARGSRRDQDFGSRPPRASSRRPFSAPHRAEQRPSHEFSERSMSKPIAPPSGMNRKERRALKFGTQTWTPIEEALKRTQEVQA